MRIRMLPVSTTDLDIRLDKVGCAHSESNMHVEAVHQHVATVLTLHDHAL